MQLKNFPLESLCKNVVTSISVLLLSTIPYRRAGAAVSVLKYCRATRTVSRVSSVLLDSINVIYLGGWGTEIVS